MPEPAVAAAQNTRFAADSMQGTLLYAPSSWSQLLVRRLSPRGRLALFRTSKRLCKQVVHSSPSVTLRLHDQTHKESKLAARQRVIADLLEGCLNLKVVLHRDDKQPFPTALSGAITELTLQVDRYSQACSPSCVNWAALQQLHTLYFRQTASAEDVRLVCEALEAGQLPCLRTLVWGPYRSAECYIDGMVMEHGQKQQHAAPKLLQRLANAAGKQIIHLAASEELLTHVSQFTSLQTVKLLRHRIKAATAQQLCEHPTLRHVTMSSESDDYQHWQVATWYEVEGNHRQRNCKWETLTLLSVKPRVLAALPLAGLKEIRFQNALTSFDPADIAPVLDARKLGVQLMCVPHDVHEQGVFQVQDLCKEHLTLLPCLQGAHTVCLILRDTAGPALLPSAYAQLPKQVTRIAINNMFLDFNLSRQYRQYLGFDKRHLWHQLPTTVTHVQLIGFCLKDFSDQLATLLHLVLEAPGHVKRLDLVKMRGIREGLVIEYVRIFAPAHLTVSIKPWR